MKTPESPNQSPIFNTENASVFNPEAQASDLLFTPLGEIATGLVFSGQNHPEFTPGPVTQVAPERSKSAEANVVRITLETLPNRRQELLTDGLVKVDIMIGGSQLSLVNTQLENSPYRSNRPFLLVDEASLNAEQGVGFKGLQDGETIVLGRSNLPDRLNYLKEDDYLSRYHLTIALNGNRLVFQDLGSTNGTTLLIHELANQNSSLTFGHNQPQTAITYSEAESTQHRPESADDLTELRELQELLAQNSDIKAFAEFLKRNRAKFSNLLQESNFADASARRETMSSLIYSRFYDRDEQAPQLTLNQRQLEQYILNLRRSGEELNKLKNVQYFPAGNYWAYYIVNGGVEKNQSRQLLRLYLNLDPAWCAQVQADVVRYCQENGLAIDTKIPLAMDQQTANRVDKMVVYFNEADQRAMMTIINQIYEKYRPGFLPGKPRFTETVRSSRDGRTMNGIGLAEDPKQGSFGTSRSDLLADLVFEYGVDVDFTNPQVVYRYKQLCQQSGIDYKNFARNLKPHR